MSFFESVANCTTEKLDQKFLEPKRRSFHPVEVIDLAEGWQQIMVGTWRGIGLLDVQEPLQQVWGSRIIIVEPGQDRRRLQECYPGLMIFEPKEIQDAVNDWPENAAMMQVKRTFSGDIVVGCIN